MERSALLFRRVEYEINTEDWGVGLVLGFEQCAGEVIVVDELSGIRWRGPLAEIRLAGRPIEPKA